MPIIRTLGGRRLGSGDKMKIAMHNYERSTHNIGNAWRSSMTVGVLTPFYKKLCLRGDTWTIDTNVLLHTAPTIGPLFGSYKIQLDFFMVPIRLYNGLLHNNWTKIGLDMAKVKFPTVTLDTIYSNPAIISQSWAEQQQIHPSSLLRYLGYKGLGSIINMTATKTSLKRTFDNAIPILAYYDIFKNYYANKQETNAYVIDNRVINEVGSILEGTLEYNDHYSPWHMEFMRQEGTDVSLTPNSTYQRINFFKGGVELASPVYMYTFRKMTLKVDGGITTGNTSLPLQIVTKNGNNIVYVDAIPANDIYVTNNNDGTITIVNEAGWPATWWENEIIGMAYTPEEKITGEPYLKAFPLQNIDEMRMAVLRDTNVLGTAYSINTFNKYPYKTVFDVIDMTPLGYYTMSKLPMQGLVVKTHQSDVLNCWLNKEWLDGINGVNLKTAVDVSAGYFTIDALTLAKKMYNLANRVAVAGGSYEDWQDVVYGEEGARSNEIPAYVGGMSGIIAFEEVVSTADTDTRAAGDQPLGTLAGKGVITRMSGGHVEVHVSEACYIMGIASITPYIDYAEDNDFDVTEISSPDDFHKPELDEIGFQNLMLERATWRGKTYDETTMTWHDNAVGKQPAWIEYMTSKNEVYGDFADPLKLGHMVLTRRYDNKQAMFGDTGQVIPVSDFTTYINPTKYNYIFADSSLRAQNFWVQIGINAVARRKMSAKIMPNP